MHVLVGGWPASGKTTLATALAAELGAPLLSKDELKEALADALGAPADVAASRRLGRAAARGVLALARRCPDAVVDSTWFPATLPLVAALPAPRVEVRCVVPVEVARARYRARAAGRHPGHLDLERDDAELWGEPVAPLGVGPLLEIGTAGAVDVRAVARRVRELAAGLP